MNREVKSDCALACAFILSKKRPTTNAFVLAYVAGRFVFCQSVGRMVLAFQMKENIRNKS